MLTLPIFSALLSVGSTYGISIPFHKRAAPHSTTVRIAPTTNVTGNDPFGFQNINNNVYTGTIFLSEQSFIVQLDTGSSDLWLDTQNATLTGLTDTGVHGSILYVDLTGAEGPIVTGNVTWGDFTVQQAFINAPGSNATGGGEFQGLLGIGPPTLSDVDAALKNANSSADGSSFLDNVFSYYPNEPNFMTFYLSRNDFGVIDGGIFTIGDVVQNFSDITSSPQLPVVAPDAFFTFMDGVIINGANYSGGSLGSPIVDVPEGKVVVVLDTGTSLSTAPPNYVDAMYANITGAEFNGQDGYTLPCDSKINISMVFGDLVYPMHPIDVTLLSQLLDNGTVLCQGVFTYAPDNAGVDFILGDSFLRNVYSLYDFGNWAKVGDTDPFMQILSVTDPDKAFAEFDALNQARIQDALALVQANNSSSPSSTDSSVPSATDSSVSSVSNAPASALAATTNVGVQTTTVTVTHPPSSLVTGTTNADKALVVQGALASDDSDSSIDVSGLTRNLFIIMGLLAVVIILLFVILIRAFLNSKNSGGKGYKAIKDPYPPQHDKPYATGYSDYSTPYQEGGH